MAETTSWIGRQVGHVRVESLLGQGGMGEVYRGFDELLERPVALKVLRHSQPRLRSRASLLREARLLCRLDHPNVCRVYDLASADGRDVLILELIEGTTLTDMVEGRGSGVALDRSLEIGAEITSALAAAHAHGIVHRDLKPDNVMITPTGAVKVLDFGLAKLTAGVDSTDLPRPADLAGHPTPDIEAALAKAGLLASTVPQGAAAPPSNQSSLDRRQDLESRTMAGVIAGTLHYMSPEQAAGRAIGPSSDLYSLGILLQELVTAKSAYPPASTVLLRLQQVSKAETLSPAGLDPALAGLLRRLQSLDPGARPDATATLAALRSTRETPARRRLRRRLRAAVLAGAALLAAVAWVARRSGASNTLDLGGHERHRVAVLPFELDPGVDARIADLAPSYADLLTQDLEPLPLLETVAAADVALWYARNGVGRPRAESASKVQTALGADLVLDLRLGPGESGGLVFEPRLWHGERQVTLRIGAPDPGTGVEQTVRRVAELVGEPDYSPQDLRLLRDPLQVQLYALARQRWDSRGAQAARPFLEALLELNPTAPKARALYADVFWHAGEIGKAEAIWRETLLQLPPAAFDDSRADVLYQLVWLETDRGRFAEAEALLAELDTVATRTPDTRSTFLDAAAFHYGSRGDAARAIALYHDLLRHTDQTGDLPYRLVTLNNLLEKLVEARRFGQARIIFAEAERLAERIESDRAAPHLAATRARLALADGTPEEFAAAATHARSLAQASADPHVLLDIEEMVHQDVVRREGVASTLAEVDRLTAAFRIIHAGRRAAELRIATARALLAAEDRAAARTQLRDVRAHEGTALLQELAPDLAAPPPGSG